jgi:hypothetical protein
MSHEEIKSCETWTALQNTLFQSGQRGKTYGTMQFDRANNLNFQQIGSQKENDYRFEVKTGRRSESDLQWTRARFKFLLLLP